MRMHRSIVGAAVAVLIVGACQGASSPAASPSSSAAASASAGGSPAGSAGTAVLRVGGRTAKVTIFAAWAKEGHGGFTDWADRGWAFMAVFGKNPHYDRSRMEPWEKEIWEKLYGKEYSE